MTPSDALKSRVLAQVKSTPSPSRSVTSRRITLSMVAVAACALGLFFAMGGPKVGTRPLVQVAFMAGTAALLSMVLLRLSAPRSSSMLPRPAVQLLAAAVASALLLAGCVFVETQIWPSHGHDAHDKYLGCAVITLIQAALPFAVLLLPRRNADPVHPMITGAALGATAGLLSAMLAYVRCPSVSSSHSLLAHVLPTLILALAGAVLGRTFLRIK